MFGFDLSMIWAALIAFAVLTYVCLDGFDLGVGILFPLAESVDQRGLMMQSVEPVWDGNETWLVLGGGGLFAVFPLAYSVVLPALYLPIIAMLLGLVFRGVAFEFRWRSVKRGWVWDCGFWLGSTLAAIMQGVVLGGLVQGIAVTERQYSGGTLDWITPFSLTCGLGVAIGYALLGATWLNLKLTGPLQSRMRRAAGRLALATLVMAALVFALTAIQDSVYRYRWMSTGTLPVAVALPVLMGLAGWALLRGLAFRSDILPFVAAQMLFILAFIGLGISVYPDMVPLTLSIAEAAAPDNSLRFALYGALVLIPVILCYTALSYWWFRGKVDTPRGEG